MTYSLKNNTIVRTDDGDVMIVPIEVCGNDQQKEFFAFGAMYMSNEGDYPFEIQFIDEDDKELIKRLNNEVGRVLEIIEPVSNNYGF
ncbi:hypothetical protein JOC34_000566 [Virgibacillus halotolerans]|uniref:hypothetical protein n=1 Tax=Virgibacillus halotolerans TaxID=1071053 RepID=UPI001961A492|nr:hypothetical protein [Virgibacillus halotolerans]MBM7598209.1 hypothetical protein [Virgibacillus halotolerans]